VDTTAFDAGDSAQLDWGEPEPGATHGQTRTHMHDRVDNAQGPKTRTRNKDIVSRR
jgi:hypothetical protein